MAFPLFRRPGSVVFLDDDPDYLEMLGMVLPRHWHIKLFLRPRDCVAHLRQETPLWEDDAWQQQQMVDRWRQGRPLLPQILAYWAAAPGRYMLSRVCVVDFSMPGMDGLQTLAALGDWPGSRVLLTGQADDQVAVRAFNRGLVQHFLAKQAPDITRALADTVSRLLVTEHARHAETWRATLDREQDALLRAPGVAEALSAWCAERWVEHVAIGAPFGVLGIDAEGQVGWLQLETRSGLPALAEVAAAAGAPAADLQAIRAGTHLADVELRQALGVPSPACSLAPAFALGPPAQGLLGALFPVLPAASPTIAGYSGWLAAQGEREVRD